MGREAREEEEPGRKWGRETSVMTARPSVPHMSHPIGRTVTCLPPTSRAGMSLLPPRHRRRLEEGRTLILPYPFLVYMRNPGPIGPEMTAQNGSTALV